MTRRGARFLRMRGAKSSVWRCARSGNAVSAISFRRTADISYVASVFRSHISSATLTTSLPEYPVRGECPVSRNRPATKMVIGSTAASSRKSLADGREYSNAALLRPYKIIRANDTNKSRTIPTSSGAPLDMAPYLQRESGRERG